MNDIHIPVLRAADELRRQYPILFKELGAVYRVLPAEFLDEHALKGFGGGRRLLITSARAKMLGYEITARAVSLDVSDLSLHEIESLYNPLEPQAILKKPAGSPATESEQHLLGLAKQASLMPALLIAPNAEESDLLLVHAEALNAYFKNPAIQIFETARAHLPIDGAENARLISYRAEHAASVHLALLVGNPEATKQPLVRIHSSCVTGDILGSLRCDCGSQLQSALQQITAAGSGILIYLHQEGRGIGLTNKLRAYALQEQGVDTYTANVLLGFDEDERDFAIAAAMLRSLKIDHIRLMTNNPRKIDALKATGIHIAGRMPLAVPSGAHNHAYLEAKAKKSGHLF